MPTATRKPKEWRITIPYAPFALTQPIHWSTARFRVLDCGRRIGKTTYGAAEGFNMSVDIVQREPGTRPRGAFIAPTYDLVREDWRVVTTLLKEAILQQHIADYWLDLGPLGTMEFKSADREGGVGRGAGYDWVILDEAARIPQQAWEEDLRPSLADRHGRAVFLSTPFGRNWFYDLWHKGQPGLEKDPQVESWKYSTIEGWRSRLATQPDALALAEQEWKAIIGTTSLRTLQQEYLAEFLEGQGQFLNVSRVLSLEDALRDGVPGRAYLAGLDVARVQDFMVTAVMEVESRQLVGLHRSRHRAWDLQRQEALALLSRYPNVHVLIDATGMGDPIVQDIQRAIPSVEAIHFSNTLKKQMVENLALACDHGLIRLPDTLETHWLLDELRDYQEWETKAGNVRYGAPEGKHDDGVTALMLALWGMRFDLQQPQEPAQLAPRDPGRFTFEEFLDFAHRGTAWRRAYPHLELPHHPWALAWEEHTRWRRFMPVLP